MHNTLPQEIITILTLFAPLFHYSTWTKAKELLIGAILTRGDRTLSNILRTLGLEKNTNYDCYYKVLNRAPWSGLKAGFVLFKAIITMFNLNEAKIAVDTTIERRFGPKIVKKGNYRDPIRSSKSRKTFTDGIQWLNFTVLIKLPWSSRELALPIWNIIIPSKKYCESINKNHKTSIDRLSVLLRLIKKYIPNIKLTIIGDGDFGNVKLGTVCKKLSYTLIARMRDDGVLHAFVDTNKKGRKATKGERLKSLKEIAQDQNQKWNELTTEWYGNEKKKLLYLSGTCLRYVKGFSPLPILWVITKDPVTKELTYLMCTDLELQIITVVGDFVKRWNIEVTHEEVRRHLGVESLRNWSEKSVDRATPILFSLYTIVVLMTFELNKKYKLPKQETAWYTKDCCTFSDCLAFVRVHLWKSRSNIFNENEDKEVQKFLYELTRAA
jgi:hypothetical protein